MLTQILQHVLTMHKIVNRFFVLFCFVSLSVESVEARGVSWVDLGGTWRVAMEGSDQAIDATVPGCIHTDLLAAKKIPDPFFEKTKRRCNG